MTGQRRRSAPPASPAELDELVTAVLTASRALVGVSARSLAELDGRVTITQFRALVVLGNHDDGNLNRLADELDVAPSTAMRMVDRLRRTGLVTRRENPDNRREVLLALTSTGRDLVAAVTRRRRGEIATIVRAMPSADRADLVRALHAFADAAGEPQPALAAELGW